MLQGNRLTRLRIQPNRAFATIPALRAPLSVLFDMVSRSFVVWRSFIDEARRSFVALLGATGFEPIRIAISGAQKSDLLLPRQPGILDDRPNGPDAALNR